MARRRRGLTPEERELWSRVTRSAQALHPLGKASPPQPEPLAKPDPGTRAKPAVAPHFRIGQSAPPPPKAMHSKAPNPAENLAESSLRMDHKVYKRMAQGKLRPEARLDLHGMTLAAAQPELVRFILSCHANGLRLVLVITGKGRGDHGPLPTRPGALRHQVPHWLHGAPLGSVVQQVTAAHYRHGGEGAYYVYLRK
ncbi:Smr/MutS family protein [Paracoccus methylarcula]|uniref:DNA mismatch repair protein MutS n=1 Tax=Paracoccus methylarcula TaxID=72022 RepID=A0A3R7P4K7_9RHOB|nr:Smr/MutS family protein [Paracoccus methylarcula]RNF34607.1 DNA mismatch repair protein MutS [Paracoccus methylarcula]